MKWPCILKDFGFHFKLHYFFFPLKNALVYVDKFQGILKNKESSKKCKIPIWVFNVVCIFQKYGKIWKVLLDHFIKHKPLFFLKNDKTYRQIFWLFYWITSEWILLNFEQICHNDLSKLTIISVPFLTYNRLSQMDIFEVENLKCKKKGIKVETIQIYFQHDFVSVFCWKISSSTKISFLWRVLLLYRNL